MAIETLASASEQDIMTFAISSEQHSQLQEGQSIAVTYWPHLHFVRSIAPIEDEPSPAESKQEQTR